MKPMTVVHDWKRQKSSPANLSKKGPVSSPLRSNEGIKIGDDVTRKSVALMMLALSFEFDMIS